MTTELTKMPSWMLVTGYFDLRKEPDASPELRATRSPEFYFEEHGSGVLSADQDLLVFTEPEFEEAVWKKRPERLHDRTRIVTQRFSDFPLFKHRDQVWANRNGHVCRRDPRNTGSFYIMCMSKFAMMRRAAELCSSSHFAWIDLGAQKLGLRNIQLLNDALAVGRDKFSVCRIAYRHPPRSASAGSVQEFFGATCADPTSTHCGGCTFCGTFFTISRSFVPEVCELAESQFLRLLDLGYGHVDEQVIAFMHSARPELFDWYIGDYAQVITNYTAVREAPEAPLYNMVLPALSAGDASAARHGAQILLSSHESGACCLDEYQLAQVHRVMHETGR